MGVRWSCGEKNLQLHMTSETVTLDLVFWWRLLFDRWDDKNAARMFLIQGTRAQEQKSNFNWLKMVGFWLNEPRSREHNMFLDSLFSHGRMIQCW